MSISGITSVVTSTGTQINYVKQDSNYIWARPVNVTIQLPWTKFSSWTITRESSYEPTATTGSIAIKSSTSDTLTDDAVLTIAGYYGDVYKLTRAAKAGYTGLIANGATFETDPTFAFRDTGGTSVQLTAPTISVYCSGEYICAEITNPNDCSVVVTAYCGASQYGIYDDGILWGIGAGWEYYNSSHTDTNTVVTKTVLAGKTVTGKWRTNNNGHDCTWGSIYAYCSGTSGTGYTDSTKTNQTGGTYHSTSSGGSSSGGFGGFGGTLES